MDEDKCKELLEKEMEGRIPNEVKLTELIEEHKETLQHQYHVIKFWYLGLTETHKVIVDLVINLGYTKGIVITGSQVSEAIMKVAETLQKGE